MDSRRPGEYFGGQDTAAAGKYGGTGVMEKNREEVFYHFGDFPAYVARECLSDYPNMSGIGHWHEDVEFVVMTKGEMTYWVD